MKPKQRLKLARLLEFLEFDETDSVVDECSDDNGRDYYQVGGVFKIDPDSGQPKILEDRSEFTVSKLVDRILLTAFEKQLRDICNLYTDIKEGK